MSYLSSPPPNVISIRPKPTDESTADECDQAFTAACDAAPVKERHRKVKKDCLTHIILRHLPNLVRLRDEKNYSYSDIAAMLQKYYPSLKEVKPNSLKALMNKMQKAKATSAKTPSTVDERTQFAPSPSPLKAEPLSRSLDTTNRNHCIARDPRKTLIEDNSQAPSRQEFNV